MGRLVVIAAALVVGIALGALGALGAAPAWANGYATDSAGVLYQVIPDERRVERIGVVEVSTKGKDGKVQTTRPTLTDLALSDLHGLYGISFNNLYKLNIRNPAKATLVGALRATYGQFNALAFDDQGRLFALEYGTLYEVNLKTGRARALGGLGGRWGSDGDLAWVGDSLYATVNGGNGTACHLVRIDMQTWRATDIGRIRVAPPVTTGPKGKTPKKKSEPKKKTGSKEKTESKKKPEPSKARRAASQRTFDDVWGLIWDGRDLYGVTSTGEVLDINIRSGHARVVTRVRTSFYGACAMLRI